MFTVHLTNQKIWEEFWKTDIINGATINAIHTPLFGPMSFLTVVYLAAVTTFLFTIAIKREFTRKAVLRLLIISFIPAWLLLALRMDYNWAKIFIDDDMPFTGTVERIVKVDGCDLYRFIEFVKRKLPAGEKIRDVEDHEKEKLIITKRPGVTRDDELNFEISKAARYYLLPVKTSKDGRFIWTYDYPGFTYDPKDNILKINNSTFYARPYARFRPAAMVFEIIESTI